MTLGSALLSKINAAVAAANEAETTAATAQAEFVSRSKAVGVLLLEAKKLHPAVKDFEAFLEKVQGLKLSRAYDLLRLAGGRTTDEQLKKDARDRQQKSRANKKKLPPPAPKKPEPNPVSVTVTESAEASAKNSKEGAAKWSAGSLREFEYACKTYLPRLNEADLKMARQFVLLDRWRSKAEAA